MDYFSGERGEADAFGNGINTQAHRINSAMSTTPQTLQEISRKCNIGNHSRIRNHMRWLVERKFAKQLGDRWALTENGSLILPVENKGSHAPTHQEADNDTKTSTAIHLKSAHSNNNTHPHVNKSDLFSRIDNIISRVNLYKTPELDKDLVERARWSPEDRLSDKDILKRCIELIAYSQRVNSDSVSNLINTGIFDEIFLGYDLEAVANLKYEQLYGKYWGQIGAIWLPRKLRDMIDSAQALQRIRNQHSSFMAYLASTRVPTKIASESDIDLFWVEFNYIQKYFQTMRLPLFCRVTSLCHMLMTLGYACVKPDSAVMAAATKLGVLPASKTNDASGYTDLKRKQVVRRMQEYSLYRDFNIRVLDRYLLISGGQKHALKFVRPEFYL
ncbi:MAG: hypothetical protein WCG31_09195 [Deltaproteobacteria bacterium]